MPDFDFSTTVWDNHRIHLIDFDRAKVPDSVPEAERHHPHKSCPDIDRVGYTDDAHADDHGPIITMAVDQGNVRVRLVRTEISTSARLYAVSEDRGIATVASPARGEMPESRKATIVIAPRGAGKTSIAIRYHWPDGPVIGRLYVVVRATRTVRVRAHLVTVNETGQATNFLGGTAESGEAAAEFHTRRIGEIIRDANHVFEPHGIRLSISETVNTAWTNAMFPAEGRASVRCMRAMAHSPNRHAARINLFFVNGTALPFSLDFAALGPPIAWAIAMGCRWPNTPEGHVGSGIIVDTTVTPFNGTILAHEFAHVFALCQIMTFGPSAGTALQWHSTGDTEGPGGNTQGVASRDDIVTRRRLMYPTSLTPSEKGWRLAVGYGRSLGAFLTQRHLAQDITFNESQRAYDFVGDAANIYAL